LALRVGDGHAAFALEAAQPFEDGDLVLLHQEVHAFGELVDNAILALHHFVKMELETFDADAKFSRVADQIVNVRGVQQLFGGNTATQQTSAAEVFIFFDNGGFQTNLGGADGGDVTARPRANHCDIKFFRNGLFSH